MRSVAWLTAEKVACWSERTDGEPDFILTEGAGAASCFVYFELTRGGVVGTHTDSAEETLIVVTGSVRATVDGVQKNLHAGDVAVVPAHAPHRIENAGHEPARVVGVFAASRVQSRFERPLQPFGLTELVTPTPT